MQKEDEILAGMVNLSGVVQVKVTKEFGESTVSRILELVENASSKKAPIERFITKFARVYTPTVVVAAILVAIIPPFLLQMGSFDVWLYRALTVPGCLLSMRAGSSRFRWVCLRASAEPAGREFW